MESKFTMKTNGNDLNAEADRIKNERDAAIDACFQPMFDDISVACQKANSELKDLLFTMDFAEIMRKYFGNCSKFSNTYKKYIQGVIEKTLFESNLAVDWKVEYDDDGPVRYEDKRILNIKRK